MGVLIDGDSQRWGMLDLRGEREREMNQMMCEDSSMSVDLALYRSFGRGDAISHSFRWSIYKCYIRLFCITAEIISGGKVCFTLC